MPTLTTAAHTWMQDVCRQFSTATGWPMRFVSLRESEKAPLVESSLRNDAGCCWFAELSDGVVPKGFLRLDVPEEVPIAPAYPAVCELADVVGGLLKRTLESERLARHRSDAMATLVDIGRTLPYEADLSTALDRLTAAVVRLTGFRSAGFFLLNAATSQLTLRSQYPMGADDIPFAQRSLTENPPDLEALTKGALSICRSDANRRLRWLPRDTSTALCAAVQSESGPLGTLWAFDRRHRGADERDSRVMESIAAQIAALLERVALIKESEDGHRLWRDTHFASRCQQQPAANLPPAAPSLDVAAVCTSRFEIGGDLCELLSLDEDRTVVVVGDASGASVAAAMVMSAMRGALHAIDVGAIAADCATEAVVRQLNRTLYEITPPHQFMTLVYGVVDTRQRCFTYTNAGHPAPLHVCGEGVEPLESHGMVLGVVPDASYGRSTRTFAPGESLVIYSDGISEALNAEKELFRTAGIVSAVRSAADKSAQDVLQTIWRAMEAHAAGGAEPDDRTLLVIRFAG